MHRRLLSCLLCGILVVSACTNDAYSPVSPDESDLPTTELSRSQAVDVIVVLNDDFAPGGHAANQAAARGVARGLGISPSHAYGTALFGFAGSIPAGRLTALDRDPRVAYWEFDQIARVPGPRPNAPRWCNDPANADDPRCGGGGGEEETPGGQTTPWGITRVGGAEVYTGTRKAWIIDSGIDLDHPDLNVDVNLSANFVFRGKDSPDDGNGHGTHVAGTVAAIDNDIDVVGVAAGASVVAVRVLDNSGSGSYSGVIAGVEYVAVNASNGDVANMSLGGPGSSALDEAVEAAAASGVKFSLAAGNSGSNANNYSPARANGANIYTVSAIGQNGCLASFSNYGSAVDYAAPGVGVESTKKGGGTTTYSGTSMAAPHVAGILLLGNVATDGTVSCGDPDDKPDPIAHR
jgi:hypothetical protein